MKKSWNNNPTRAARALLFALLLGVGACQSEPQSIATAPAAGAGRPAAAGNQYTCPMHPQIIRDQPGPCPICGMNLVKKPSVSAAAAPTNGSLAYLLQAPNATVVAAQATVHPAPDGPVLRLRLPGRVEYDVRRTDAIAARIGGRIEKLLVRYNYQPVTKGQKLLELYSPQLVTAQQELIFILTNDADNQILLRGTRQKLRLLGLSEAQIDRTAATRKPSYKVAIYSPYTGYVVEQSGLASGASLSPLASGGSDMGRSSSDPMGGGAPTTDPAPTAPRYPRPPDSR